MKKNLFSVFNVKAAALIMAVLLSVNLVKAQFSGGGAGTAADPYKIVTAADLAMVRNFVGATHADKYFVLQNNVDLNGDNWIPIGTDETTAFAGNFDGKGFKVQGLHIERSDYRYVGLFGYNKGVIQNLEIEGIGITNNYTDMNDSYIGGLVGYNNGSDISNCNVNLDITVLNSYLYIGGLIGYNSNGNITDCTTTGALVANASIGYSGGLIGYSDNGNISGCYTSGSISGYTDAGGLIGYNTSSIAGSHSNVAISNYNNHYCGGLIGENYGSVNASYATGNTSGNYSGGLIGFNNGNIEKCYATGNSSSYFSSGGLIGSNNGTVINCYAKGSSSSSSSYPSGGLIGDNSNKVSNCYATGTSDSNGGPRGAVIGTNSNASYISQCYYNTDISGTLAAIGSGNGTAMGLTTAGMKVKSVFVGWDFDTVWDIVEGSTYPFLSDLMPPAGTDVIGGKRSVCNGSASDYQFEAGKSFYYWTVTGGEIKSGQGTNSITVQWSLTTGTGNVSLNYGDGTTSKEVQIAELPALTISGNTQPQAGTSESYSVDSGQSSYTWTVEGGAITAGQSTNNITVLWDCNAAQRSVSLTYSNTDGCSATSEMSIIATEVHPSIVGNMNPVSNNTPVSYITEAGKSDYVWTVTNGVIQAGQGNASVLVLWNEVESLTNGHITVNYSDDKGCRATAATDSIVGIRASDDATLASLDVNTGVLTPTFSANVASYTVSVPYSTTGITVSASPHHAGATLTGTGANTLNEGANDVSITVTAKDGVTQKTYTIAVTREPKSPDATLSSLTVDIGTLTPAFDPAVTSYMVTVASNVPGIMIQATANHPGASLTGDGAKTLITGENSFGIMVTAENGAINTYNLTVIRDVDSESLAEIAQLKADTTALRATNRDLQTQLATANVTVGSLQNENTALQTQLTEANDSIGNLQGQIDTANNTISTLQSENASLQSQLTEANSTISDLQGLLDVANNTISDLQEQLSTANNTIADLQAQLDESESQLIECLGSNSTPSINAESLQLYPNPATNHITVSGLKGNEILRFYDIRGTLLFIKEATQETEDIAIGHLSAGVYLLKVNSSVIKVVKK